MNAFLSLRRGERVKEPKGAIVEVTELMRERMHSVLPFTLTDAQGPPQRRVNAQVKLTPADAAEGAEWFKVTAWQGGVG